MKEINMIDFRTKLDEATKYLANFLSINLPLIYGAEWWKLGVTDKITSLQFSNVNTRILKSIFQLDLAALLQVMDKNWKELSIQNTLPFDDFIYVKEMKSVRNRWAHSSSEEFTIDDIYRDIDTLERFYKTIKVSQDTIIELNKLKKELLLENSRPKNVTKVNIPKLKIITVPVNDTDTLSLLNRIGKAVFIEYYEQFKDSSLSNTDIVEMMPKEYTLKSRQSRTSKARRIIREGREEEALEIITAANIEDGLREKAKVYLANLL
jgi:hypothetical protein